MCSVLTNKSETAPRQTLLWSCMPGKLLNTLQVFDLVGRDYGQSDSVVRACPNFDKGENLSGVGG